MQTIKKKSRGFPVLFAVPVLRFSLRPVARLKVGEFALSIPVKYRGTFVMVPFIWPFDRGYVVTQDVRRLV